MDTRHCQTSEQVRSHSSTTQPPASQNKMHNVPLLPFFKTISDFKRKKNEMMDAPNNHPSSFCQATNSLLHTSPFYS
eukprot:m.50638 g.50638  ORF g.50638 m.50638 type:complete len:77 (+) comp7523_c1_seq2:1077-1307(+)